MRVFCDNCSAEFDVSYWRLGSDYPCPSCALLVHLDREHVRTYSESGYEVTFADFIQLVTDSYYSPTILPLLRAWYGIEPIEPGKGGTDSEVLFRDADGNRYEVLEIHGRIQNDPPRQQ